MQSQPIQDSLATTRLNPDRNAQKASSTDIERLKQLIQTLRSLRGSLPTELQGLVGSLISEAEAALESGDPVSIGRLIAKIEEVLALLQEILRLLEQGEVEQANEAIALLMAKLTGAKKAKDQMIRQQEASLEASLEAMMSQWRP